MRLLNRAYALTPMTKGLESGTGSSGGPGGWVGACNVAQSAFRGCSSEGVPIPLECPKGSPRNADKALSCLEAALLRARFFARR